MAYQIECVIQEVEFENGRVKSLKIKGTEGYLLKQGSEEYNVFCPVSVDGKIECGKQTVLLNVKDVLNLEKTDDTCDIAQTFVQAKTSNAKVRLKFDEHSLKPESIAGSSNSGALEDGSSQKDCEKIKAKITSITLI